MPLEARGLLACWSGTGNDERLVVLGACKVPHANRRVLATQFGIDPGIIDLEEGDVGGGFGARGEFYPEDFLIPFAARALGRPVKWVEDRREHLLATNHARDATCELELACTLDGQILALRGSAHTNLGAYIRTNGVTPSRNIAQVGVGPYRIEHVQIDVSVHLSNKTPVGTYRGPGRFETDFFRERLFDLVAEDLGLDRVEFRRRNLVTSSDMPWALPAVMPWGGGSECDSGNYASTLDRALVEFDWSGKSALNGRQIDGRWHGIALGCYLEGGASGPREGARLVLQRDGRIAVFTGSSSIGQGLETVFTQIAADALGVPPTSIAGIHHGSTRFVKEGFGAYSSRSTVMGGSAIIGTAADLKEKIRKVAARLLACTEDEVTLVGTRAEDVGGRSVSFAQIAEWGDIEAESSFSSNRRTYSYGAHACHVAVDPGTGGVEVLDYVAVEDVGRIINPLTLHGQATGAIVQGLGGVFMEHLVHDEEGQLLTASLADYLLPTATDFPSIRVFALEEHPSPNNPLGAKGAGEGGIIPVGGVIANAVAAALRPLGVQITELPLSPSRLWTIIDAARAAATE
jgi:carbon-monoxide dehydrogenase large subunit